MEKVASKLTRTLAALGLALVLCGPAIGAEVCRTFSFQGMQQDVARIKSLLSAETTDPSKIEIYVTRIDGHKYIQSNFRSEIAGRPGERHEYPTKLRAEQVNTLESALTNIIFDDPGSVPREEREAAVRAAASTVTVLVDRATVDHNGRPEIDLSGAQKLRLVDRTSSLATGALSSLPLRRPPPSIVEALRGCCLKGRPPGRGPQIMEMLTSKKVSSDSTVLLNMVVDTATSRAIAASPQLSAASKRAGSAPSESWEGNIDAAMLAARGKTLLLLAHIEGDSAVVLDHRGRPTFRVGLAELRQKAEGSGAELFVLGCDTAQAIEANSLSLGVVGTHNSRALISKVGEALPRARNLADLAEALSGPELTLVAYEPAGGNGFAGASGFAKAKSRKESLFVRVFRLFALR